MYLLSKSLWPSDNMTTSEMVPGHQASGSHWHSKTARDQECVGALPVDMEEIITNRITASSASGGSVACQGSIKCSNHDFDTAIGKAATTTGSKSQQRSTREPRPGFWTLSASQRKTSVGEYPGDLLGICQGLGPLSGILLGQLC